MFHFSQKSRAPTRDISIRFVSSSSHTTLSHQYRSHSRTLPKVPSTLSPGAYSQPCQGHNLTNRATKCQPGGESTCRLYGVSLSTARERASIKNPFENFRNAIPLFFERYRLGYEKLFLIYFTF